MGQRIEIAVAEIRADPVAVLGALGYAATADPDERTAALLREALDLLSTQAAPVGILEEVSVTRFEEIYPGEGRNEPDTPLAVIYPRAESLALLAVTLGEAVSARCAELFASRDFVLATMLDAAASEATERAADVVENRFRERLSARGVGGAQTRLLRYSPGYCGWHVTGQRALFAALQPETVGITLRESCLMQPLKSLSGVIVAGPAAIHDFADHYPFCGRCRARGCRERIRRAWITAGSSGPASPSPGGLREQGRRAEPK